MGSTSAFSLISNGAIRYIALPTASTKIPSQINGSPLINPSTSASAAVTKDIAARSEEHTSELQSLAYLVCRLLLEKKKKKKINNIITCSKHKATDNH